MNQVTTPSETAVPGLREQIVEAADAHFSRYGYAKTTMADLAKAIGFSKAYIYKFFESKQAIGEAICTLCLSGQYAAVLAAVDAAKAPHDKFRALFRTIVEQSREQLFEDRQLYEIVVHSCTEKWSSSEAYVAKLDELLTSILREGRDAGDFERKTPGDEISRAIWLAMSPFVNPVLLQHNLDDVAEGMPMVVNLVLRSLAP